MDITRFTVILEAYGADPRRWPEAERAAAQRLMESSSEARRLATDAAGFDALLAAPPSIEPGAALSGRILAALPAPQPTFTARIAKLFRSFAPSEMMPQFATLALALFLGLAAGFSDFDFVPAEDSQPIAVQLVSLDTGIFVE